MKTTTDCSDMTLGNRLADKFHTFQFGDKRTACKGHSFDVIPFDDKCGQQSLISIYQQLLNPAFSRDSFTSCIVTDGFKLTLALLALYPAESAVVVGPLLY